jgi:general secretion pathway protein K
MRAGSTPPTRRARHAPRRQRGAALLTAMIIVTLVATLAAAMVWQQWRSVQVEAAERARAQSAWILSGALDFARLILREDQKSGRPTALTEPWATPLAEARLSTFLAVDKANADDGPEAFLSGSIADAQARYNLARLVNGGKPVPPEIETLEHLCQTLGLDTGIANRIATGLLNAAGAPAGGGGGSPLLPKTVAQLAWLGIDARSLQTLEPYVVLLPETTVVNVNTAPKEVLIATIKGLDAGTAERLVQARQRKPFADRQSVEAQIPGVTLPVSVDVVRSTFFEVTGRARLVDHILTERTMVQRMPGVNGALKLLTRERVASVEQLGS